MFKRANPRSEPTLAAKPAAIEYEPPMVIPRCAAIEGDITSKGAVRIEGRVNGTIRSPAIELTESGEVVGNLMCDDATIAGSVSGYIEAARLEIASTARVTGDVVHESIEVSKGATLSLNYAGPRGARREGETLANGAAAG